MAVSRAKFDFDVVNPYSGRDSKERAKQLLAEFERFRAEGGTGRDLARQLGSAYKRSSYRLFSAFGMEGCDPLVLAIDDYSACAFPALLPLVRDLREDLVAEVLRRGANVECGDDTGTPLVWAALQAQNTFTHYYMGRNVKPDPARVTVAARIVDLLLRAKANPNAHSHIGCTALMHAATASADEMVRLLVAAGADVNRYDCNGRTALHEAVTSPVSKVLGERADNACTVRTVHILLEAGANPNVRSFRGQMPIHEMAVYGHHLNRDLFDVVLRSLLEAGGDLEAKNDEGLTPLLLACQNSAGASIVIPALIEAGADTGAKTPLGVGISQMGNPETKRLLKATLLARSIDRVMTHDDNDEAVETADASGVI